MKAKISEKEWLREFQEFAGTSSIRVPVELSQTIVNGIARYLNPSAWTVFTKLLGIHLMMSCFSLVICDQFGMSPFNTGFSLSQYFMKFGHSICMFICGVLFLSLSILAARLFLAREEFIVLCRNSVIQVLVLSSISFGLLMMLGVETTFEIGSLWILGAASGGVLTSWIFRPRLILRE